MLYNYKEALNKFGSRKKIKNMVDRNDLFKVNFNIYSENKNVSPLALYSKKYPKSVITLDTALYFYHLTDVIPDKIMIATYNKARKIDDVNVKQIYSKDDNLYTGTVTLYDVDGEINIYDKERLLIEFIKRRNYYSFDYYKEVIHNYRDIADELDMEKIEKYLKNCKYPDKVFDVIQREVF